MKFKKITAVLLTSLTLTAAAFSPSMFGQDENLFGSITAEAVLSSYAFADAQYNNFTLTTGKMYYSPNKQYCVVFQSDGNLVVYKCNPSTKATISAVWNTGTYGNPNSTCVMQKDGNLVIYNSANTPIWNTRTSGKNGAYLTIMDDGELNIYSRNYRCFSWTNGYHGSTTQTQQPSQPSQPSNQPSSGNSSSSASTAAANVVVDALNGTVELTPGKFYTPPQKQYVLVFQGDGNLVVYRYNSSTGKAYDPVWNSGTHGNSGARCFLQEDGNLVIYTSSMSPIWNTRTSGKRRATLYIKDDGEISVVSRDTNSTTWSNNYHGSYTVTTPPATTTRPTTTTTTTTTARKTTASSTRTVTTGTTTTTTVKAEAHYYAADASNRFGRLFYEDNLYRIVAEDIDTSNYNLIKCTEQSKIDWDMLKLFTVELDDGLLPTQSYGDNVNPALAPYAALANLPNILSSVATRYTVRFNFYQHKSTKERIVQIVGSDSNSAQLANSVDSFNTYSGYEYFAVPNDYLFKPGTSPFKMELCKSTLEHHAYFGKRREGFYKQNYGIEWYGDYYFWIDENGHAMKTLRAFKGDRHSIYLDGYKTNMKYINPRTIFDQNGNVMFLVDQKGDVTSQHGYRYPVVSAPEGGEVISPATAECMFGYGKADKTYCNLMSLVQISTKIK